MGRHPPGNARPPAGECADRDKDVLGDIFDRHEPGEIGPNRHGHRTNSGVAFDAMAVTVQP